MKKLVYFGFALLMGLVSVACSSDDDTLPVQPAPAVTGKTISWGELTSAGGKDSLRFVGWYWDYISGAKAYYGDIYTPVSETGTIGTEIKVEQVGDTTICDWAKIYRAHKDGWMDCMVVEATPNETGKSRFIVLEIAVTEPEFVLYGVKYEEKHSIQTARIVQSAK